MTAERGFRIYWGPTLENTLDFVNPVVGDSPLVWRAPRDGSTILSNGASSVAWVTGRYYYLQVQAKYFASAQWAGGNGLQAFMDWAADSNPFTLVPNLLLPALTVPGCYLEGPFLNPQINLENDTSQTIQLQFLHPTVDLGLAWRGLFFEYAAGGSLTDPLVYNYNRTSIGYELNWQGYLTQNPAGTICDGNYPNPFVTGLQTTLLEDTITNDVTNPEDLTNASWVKTGMAISANTVKAPDTNFTGDLMTEDSSTGNHLISSNAASCAAQDPITVLAFVRSNGRFKGWLRANPNDAQSGIDTFGVNYDLHAGTVTSHLQGAGALQNSGIVSLANGWWMVWMRGTMNASSLSYKFQCIMLDASGNASYTGDGASGAYLWGATAVHGAHNQVGSYTPTTSATDSLTAPWTQAPQAQWDYAMFVDLSPDTDPAQTYTILQTGATAFTGVRCYLVKNRNTITANLSDGVTSALSSVTLSAPLNYGDVVEVFRTITSAGVVQVRAVVNGGAEQVGSTSTPFGTLPAAWHDQILSIGEIGGGLRYCYGLARIKSGPYVVGGVGAVTTIAQARAA